MSVGSTKEEERRRNSSDETLVIRPVEGRSYGEVLGELRRKVKSKDSQPEIRSIWQTKNSSRVRSQYGQSGIPRRSEQRCRERQGAAMAALELKMVVEIKDLDCLTEESEVEEALRRDFPELGEAQVFTSHRRTKDSRRLPGGKSRSGGWCAE